MFSGVGPSIVVFTSLLSVTNGLSVSGSVTNDLSVSGSVTNGLSFSEGLRFRRVTSFSNYKVTSDTDAVDVFAHPLPKCASQCSIRTWCTSFFFTKATGACSLHPTVFIDAATVAVTSSGTQYYTNVLGWCSPQDQRLYIRQAQMCVYFEMNSAKKASSWSTAHSACVNLGMGLASNLTPVKMDALVAVTQKNPALSTGPIYIGLKRTAPGANTLEWVDQTPLNVSAMEPYWEANQPNGQDCVIIRAHVDSTLNDAECADHAFVCELLP